MKTNLRYFLALLFLAATTLVVNAAAPQVGDKAPDFTLQTLDDKPVKLSDLTAKEKVVLVVLRGWPGYQCPLCTKQVRDFTNAAEDFAKTKTRVVMVYPGPSDKLKAHAKEFLGNAEWPKDFTLVIDPDYTMVNAYNLRWDAKAETSYPSTFVIDRKGVVRFAKISKGHGGRSQAAEVVKAAAAIGAE
jgi:peroxiredoxin Q/BCP